MKKLEERILKDGKVLLGDVLKVDSFLNHQIDVQLLSDMAEEIYNKFSDRSVTKVLTIEASGISIACTVAGCFSVPCLFAKKNKINKNLGDNLYCSQVKSFTHGTVYNVVVSKDFLASGDRVIIVDDFLANGNALRGLINIVKQAGAEVAGIAIAIEKGYQGGGDSLRKEGYTIESLAIVEEMNPDTGEIRFRD